MTYLDMVYVCTYMCIDIFKDLKTLKHLFKNLHVSARVHRCFFFFTNLLYCACCKEMVYILQAKRLKICDVQKLKSKDSFLLLKITHERFLCSFAFFTLKTHN